MTSSNMKSSFFRFSLRESMLHITITFLSLITMTTNQRVFEAQFQITSFGMEFQYSTCSNLCLNQSNVASMTLCATICCTQEICLTFDYDTSTQVCRLFSIWADQGALVLSTSSTSLVGYVQRSYELYSLYGKPCNNQFDINRYLTCTNQNVWSCQAGQVYNGTICQIEKVYNNTTSNNQQQCLQNQSMYWNGTYCLPITYSWRWNITGITVAGATAIGNANPDRFYQPNGLALGSNNTLYIADQYNNRVQKWLKNAVTGTTVAGQANGTASNDATSLHYPESIIVDSNANVYVADSWNHRVQLWLNGATSGITIAGTGYSGSANNQLDYPRDVARDPSNGTIYISDSWNHRIMRYDVNATTGIVVAGGNGAGTGATQLNFPMGLYLELVSKSLYIVNYQSNNVVRWVLGASSWTLVAGDANGTSGSSSLLLFQPFDVTLDFMNNVYVVDTMNHRIQFFQSGSLNGTTIAGINGTIRSDAYGFYQPHSVLIDSQLNLYVSDCFNFRVQKFVPY